jgi:RNA polymerase sigma-70 factor (ECF subfamily)
MDTTPVSLLERLRQPDQPRAWERFVELYTPLLYSWARRTGWPESDAADLVQEVLTLLVRKLPEFTYDRHRSFRGWLHVVARNCWLNLLRRAELPRAANVPDLTALAAPEAAEPFEEREYRHWLVGRALALMRADFEPATWRACWECVVGGRPAADVARELGVRVGTVYAARSRVLSRLRRELAGLLE